jgi:hydrogenase maturation protease
VSGPRILVAGIGNEFLGDDGFGVEVARRLAPRWPPAEVRVVEIGTRGFDLACELAESYDAVFLLDAGATGGPPGTLQLIDLECAGPSPEEPSPEPHRIDLGSALRLAALLGGRPAHARMLCCEPLSLEPSESGGPGLSEPVAAAAEAAVALLESLVAQALRSGTCTS